MGICLRQPVREQERLLETPGSGTGKDTRFPVLSENTQSHEHSDLLARTKKDAQFCCTKAIWYIHCVMAALRRWHLLNFVRMGTLGQGLT